VVWTTGTLRAGIAAFAAALALLLAVGAPLADADSTHPSDPSFAWLVTPTMVGVCDGQADGHQVWARVVTYHNLNIVYSTPYDPNGAKLGCELWPTPHNYVVYKYVVCVQYEGCGRVQYVA
jgi:hypothetical protein